MKPPPLTHRTEAEGFTLLEILLAVGLLGILILAVYGVFSRTLEAKEHAETVAAVSASARSVLARIARDLLAVAPRPASTLPVPTPTPTPRGGLPEAVQQYLFVSRNRGGSGAVADDLAFSAWLPRPASPGRTATDLAVVHYFLASDPANPNRRALFREALPSLSGKIFDPERPDPASTVRLLDGVAGIEFRFYDGRQWVEQWDSTDPRNFAPAPQAVEVSLAVLDERGEPEIFRTAVDLPIVRAAAGLGKAPTAPSSSFGRAR